MMKQPLYKIIAIVFLTVSIWLSFTIKKVNSEIVLKSMQHHQSEEQNRMLLYRQRILQDAFVINMINEPISIFQSIPRKLKDGDVGFILYLKAHACSPCNMGVIKSILKRFSENQQFYVVSHPSNRHFLKQALNKAQIGEYDNRVIWLNEKLYIENHAVYDAELLFINSIGYIQGIFPLELLKEGELFEPVIAEKLKMKNLKTNSEN
jgi:hypothetical protein